MCVCNWADKWRSGPGPVSVTTEYTRLRQSQSELAFYAAAWILALEHVCGFLLWLSLQEREPTGSWQSEGLLAGSEAMDNRASQWISAAQAWRPCYGLSSRSRGLTALIPFQRRA